MLEELLVILIFLLLIFIYWQKYRFAKRLIKIEQYEREEGKEFGKIIYHNLLVTRKELEETTHTLRSERVRFGQIFEQFLPFMKNFDYNPKDVRFLGSPIDLIIFNGLDKGESVELVIGEIKTGKSKMSEREKLVKDAVKNKRIVWEEFRE